MINQQVFNDIMYDVDAELLAAQIKFPGWPDDPIHAMQVINEELGEANRALLQAMYENHSVSDVEQELIQTMAMCVRWLASSDKYNWAKSEQHTQ